MNGRYPDTVPLSTVPPQVLQTLPKLGEDMEYRFIGERLVLYDVHAHLVDQTCSKHLATDVAGGDLDHAVTRKLLRLGHGCLDAVDEVERRLGVPAPGLRPVRHDDHVVDPARRLPVPAVRHVEDVAADECRPDLVPVRPGVVVGRLRHLHLAGLVQRDVTAGHPLEQRAGLVSLVRDEAVHRYRAVQDHLAHGLLLLCSGAAHAGVSGAASLGENQSAGSGQPSKTWPG